MILTTGEREALQLIKDTQRTVSTLTIRDIQKALGYKSPNSAYQLVNSLEQKGVIRREGRGIHLA